MTISKVVKSIAVGMLCLTAEAGTLPEGYCLARYLESNGTQYLDTGVIAKPSTRLVMKFAYTVADKGGGAIGYGASSSAQSFRFWRSIDKDTGNAVYNVNIDDKYGNVDSYNSGAAPDTEIHVIDISNTAKSIDGHVFENTKGSLTKNNAGSLYLFGQHWGWSPTYGEAMKGRIYSCQIYEGQNLVRDFVPCVRQSDNVAGLYDTIGNGKVGKFYTILTSPKGDPLVIGKLSGLAVSHTHANVFTAAGFKPGLGESVTNGSFTCTAPMGEQTTGDGKVKYVVTGWKLVVTHGDNTVTEMTDAGTSIDLNIGETDYAELEWQLAPQYLVSVSARGSGTVAPSEPTWVPEGGQLQIAAEPAGEGEFLFWLGNITNRVTASQEVVVEEPVKVVASFDGVAHIASSGLDDASGGEDDPTSLKTVLALAKNAPMKISVAPGTYPITAEILVTNGTTFVGTGARPEDVVFTRDANSGNHGIFKLDHPDAAVRNMIIEKGSINATYGYGAGVYIAANGGTVSNCVVRNCYVGGHHGSGIAIYCNSDAGRVSHCVITNQTTGIYDNNYAGAVMMEKGRIDNSLVAYNSDPSSGYGGQITLRNSAVAENCTVVGNTAKICSGIYITSNKATARNCVMAGNVTASARPEDTVWAGKYPARFINCVSDGHAPNSETCYAGPELVFVNSAAGDWRPTAASKAVNFGTTEGLLNGSTTDLDGKPRISGATIDAGCYELDASSFAVGVAADIDVGFIPATVTLTAKTFGAGEDDELDYYWDTDGDGVTDVVTDVPEATVAYADPGTYSIGLAVTNRSQANAGAETVAIALFKLGPRTLYVVDKNPNAAEPYDTFANAAADIQTAIDYALVDAEVVISNGTYLTTKQLDFKKRLTVRGYTGRPEDVIVNVQKKARCMEFNADSKALLHSVTLQNGSVNGAYGAGIYLISAGGIVSNCIIRGCTAGGKWGACAGIYAENDKCFVTHTVISNCCQSTGTDGGNLSGPLDLAGSAKASHCLLAYNHHSGGYGCATIQIANGSATWCTVVTNKAYSIGGINVNGTGSFSHCLIAGNTSACAATNPRYNVWGAVNKYSSYGFGTGDDTRAVNATILARQKVNVSDVAAINDTCLYAEGGLSQLLPFLRTKGRFTPDANCPPGKRSSPANGVVAPADAGVMPELDLFGHPRLLNGRYDLGAVEGLLSGFSLIVR